MRWYWLVPVTVISIPICFLIYPINEPRVRLADEATDINNNACRESELCCLLGNTSAPFYRICPGGYCFFHYETDVRALRIERERKKLTGVQLTFLLLLQRGSCLLGHSSFCRGQEVCELDPEMPVGCCCAALIVRGGGQIEQRACNDPFIFSAAQNLDA